MTHVVVLCAVIAIIALVFAYPWCGDRVCRAKRRTIARGVMVAALGVGWCALVCMAVQL